MCIRVFVSLVLSLLFLVCFVRVFPLFRGAAGQTPSPTRPAFPPPPLPPNRPKCGQTPAAECVLRGRRTDPLTNPPNLPTTALATHPPQVWTDTVRGMCACRPDLCLQPGLLFLNCFRIAFPTAFLLVFTFPSDFGSEDKGQPKTCTNTSDHKPNLFT